MGDEGAKVAMVFVVSSVSVPDTVPLADDTMNLPEVRVSGL
jgi:hypothetical protein